MLLDYALNALDFGHLIFIMPPLGLDSLLAEFCVARIINGGAVRSLIRELDRFIADFIKKISVVRNDEHRALIRLQIVFEPFRAR